MPLVAFSCSENDLRHLTALRAAMDAREAKAAELQQQQQRQQVQQQQQQQQQQQHEVQVIRCLPLPVMLAVPCYPALHPRHAAVILEESRQCLFQWENSKLACHGRKDASRSRPPSDRCLALGSINILVPPLAARTVHMLATTAWLQTSEALFFSFQCCGLLTIFSFHPCLFGFFV